MSTSSSRATFDPTRLRADHLLPRGPAPAVSRRQRRGLDAHAESAAIPERFLKGPIALAWLAAAGRLPSRALHVAVALEFLAGVTRRRTDLPLSYKLLTRFGLDRHAAYRAVRDLEGAGLIRVVARGPGRCPLVSLLALPSDPNTQEAP